MEKIIVEFYSNETGKINKTELSCYGLKEAIEAVRSANEFKVVVISAEYKDKQAFIDGIKKMNETAL